MSARGSIGAQRMRILLMMAVLPAAILLVYIYQLDPVEKEPASLLGRLLLFGMLSTIPAMLIEAYATYALFGNGTPNGLEPILIDNFIVVALTEESCKYVFLRWKTWRSPYFDYVYDGIVYAVFVGLGFAIAENIVYVFSYGPSVAFFRAFTAIPGHCVFAVFMGYFYGNAREEKSRGRGGASASLSFCALLVPVFCHGTYDTLASISSTMSDLLFFANIIVLVAIAMRLVKKVSAERRQISRW